MYTRFSISLFFFSSRRRHTRLQGDWSSDVCSSDVAEELRKIMAEMGFRTVEEMIGRVDRIDMKKAVDHWKADGVDLSRLLHKVEIGEKAALYQTETQDHGLGAALDNGLIEAAMPAL